MTTELRGHISNSFSTVDIKKMIHAFLKAFTPSSVTLSSLLNLDNDPCVIYRIIGFADHSMKNIYFAFIDE